MKAPYYIVLFAFAFVVGCGKNEPAAAPGSSVTPANAASSYANALVNGQNSARKTVDLASLTEAISMFNVQEGRFPKNLNELVEKQTIAMIPDAPPGMKLNYDPATGKVTMVKAD